MDSEMKCGFVYLWFDRTKKMYYIGCHWGTTSDGYLCSSRWMRRAYANRPKDFKRRILKTNLTRQEMYAEETRYLSMIKQHEVKNRYYNLNIKSWELWHAKDDARSIGEKISAAKTGKPVNFNDPKGRGRKISEAKKAKFQKRLEETGSKMTPEHRVAMSASRTGVKKDEAWCRKRSELSKKMWETRPRAQPKVIMTKEQQAAHTSAGLKSRWADPEWAARQRERLKEGAKRRREREKPMI